MTENLRWPRAKLRTFRSRRDLDTFLVVWTERSTVIRGRFFSVADRIPIGSSFDISDRVPTWQLRVDVAAGPDDEFLVVWWADTVRAAKVTLHDGVAASTNVGSGGGRPHVAWTGDAWFVTWTGTGEMGDWAFAIVLGIRLDRDGAPLDAAPFRLCHKETVYDAIVVRVDDGVVLVCSSSDSWSTWTTRRDGAGNESPSVSTYWRLPESAASNEHEVLVTFTDENGPTEGVEVDA